MEVVLWDKGPALGYEKGTKESFVFYCCFVFLYVELGTTV